MGILEKIKEIEFEVGRSARVGRVPCGTPVLMRVAGACEPMALLHCSAE